jgi:hypothetical protein
MALASSREALGANLFRQSYYNALIAARQQRAYVGCLGGGGIGGSSLPWRSSALLQCSSRLCFCVLLEEARLGCWQALFIHPVLFPHPPHIGSLRAPRSPSAAASAAAASSSGLSAAFLSSAMAPAGTSCEAGMSPDLAPHMVGEELPADFPARSVDAGVFVVELCEGVRVIGCHPLCWCVCVWW